MVKIGTLFWKDLQIWDLATLLKALQLQSVLTSQVLVVLNVLLINLFEDPGQILVPTTLHISFEFHLLNLGELVGLLLSVAKVSVELGVLLVHDGLVLTKH